MVKKKISPKKQEQKEFRVFDPRNVKKTVEIPAKKTLSEKDIIKVEKPGKKITKKKKTTKRKTSTKKSTKTPQKTPQKSSKLNPKGHVLIITEKPQAAAKIASALSEGHDKKTTVAGVSYYELERNKERIVVACAVGHLFSVSQNIKGTNYPIYDISWFPNFQVRKKDFTKKYYNQIAKLAKNTKKVIVATDFDVEGEVIGYNIVRFITKQKDASRMKFSSLTAKEIQDSYDNCQPTLEWGQAIAGETRHFIDWLYGINLSRALMSSIKTTGKFRVMSIGRVQGPALKMIVDKEHEIQKFKPTPYWQVFITITDGKNTLELKHNKDLTKKSDLEKFKKLVGKESIAKTSLSKQSIQPPAPFDLTSLQTESYKFNSITPAQTLAAAQKLYLAGIISYPRTSSQKIPETIEPKKILKKLEKNYSSLTKHSTRQKPIEGKKSDPAHPAITPTGIYQSLDRHEEKIYDLIVKRFISCFCDNANLENKKVELEIDKLKFSERGLGILKKGWLYVYPAKLNEKEIPSFNGNVKITKVRTEEKETKPPRRYSPASIISELEKRNLGTKATRANILETLYDRKYIKDRSIQATILGIKLIDSLKKYSPVIIDENLTKEIEKDMDNIRSSKKELDKKEQKTIKKAENAIDKISKDFKSHEKSIGKDLINANNSLWEQEKEDNKLDLDCPGCKKGKLTIKYTPRFKSYFIACSEYPECKQTFSLPSQSLIKKADKTCNECSWPMLIRIKAGKRPWIFCFNPECPTRLNKDDNNNKESKQA